jgi:hypothetical protein
MRSSHNLSTHSEAPKSGAEVSKTPTGPPTPTSGWTAVFADGFGAELGTTAGKDNFWYPNKDVMVAAASYQPGHNANELQAFHSSAVRITSEGLALDVTQSTKVATVTPPGGAAREVDYVGSEVTTVWGEIAGKPAGYSFFRWKPCQGGYYCCEIVAKFPPNTGEMDPGWWAYDSRNTGWNGSWNDEVDFLELWGWPKALGAGPNYQAGAPVWKYKTGNNTDSSPAKTAYHEDWNVESSFGFKPSNGFNRYTWLLNPDNSMAMYINGALKFSVPGAAGSGATSPGTGGAPPASGEIAQVWMGLVLQNALRRESAETYSTAPNFKTGTRTATIRSIAFYRDTEHETAGIEKASKVAAEGTTLV